MALYTQMKTREHITDLHLSELFNNETHGKNPILAASWIGVKSRKFSRVASAPASSRMETDSFF